MAASSATTNNTVRRKCVTSTTALAPFGSRRSASRGNDEVFDLVAVYQDLLEEDGLVGFEVPVRFYEVGSPEGLKETRAYFAAKGIAIR